jgi:hypothetical protein
MNLLTMGVDFAELSDAEIEQRVNDIFKCEYCSDASADVYHSFCAHVSHVSGEKLVAMMPFCRKIQVH